MPNAPSVSIVSWRYISGFHASSAGNLDTRSSLPGRYRRASTQVDGRPTAPVAYFSARLGLFIKSGLTDH
jgi:hypothetical protein